LDAPESFDSLDAVFSAILRFSTRNNIAEKSPDRRSSLEISEKEEI